MPIKPIYMPIYSVHDVCACRAQASLGWLVLNANQLESSPSHPGSIAIAGDFNKHCVIPPQPSATRTLHNLKSILNVQVKRTWDSDDSRAYTALHVKKMLKELCRQLEAKKAVIFEGRSCLPSVVSRICVLLSAASFAFDQQVHRSKPGA